MDEQDEEFELWPQGWQQDTPARETMRERYRVHRSPSSEDLKVRRRNRRTTAGGDVQKRAELVRALTKAATFTEQERLLDEITKIDNGLRAQAAQDRELDLSQTVVRDTLTPVRVHEHHTAATDWLGDADIPDQQWQSKVVAEAALWYGRVPEMVKADPQEFSIQAQGMARRVAGPYGLQAQAAQAAFLRYATFLHKDAASGLDQIQQTVDPNNSPKTTPLDPTVFDNFAPDIDPINQGVSGTEDSNRAPLIQEIVGGGSGMDGGQPEKPGGHSETDELSWAPPSGMQADTAPGWTDGDPGTPEEQGGHTTASLDFRPGMAIGHTMTMDDYLALQAAARKAAANTARKAASLGKCGGCGTDLTVGNAADREGMVCKSCANRTASRTTQAASGLPMIQETVDANNQPHTPTPIPPAVAFPLDGDMQEEWTTGGTGNAAPGAPQQPKAAVKKRADMFGADDAPHAVVQPDVANTPATTPPTAQNAGGAAAGAADAKAGNAPTFADDSASVPAPAQQYPAGYAANVGSNFAAPDEPASMAGPGNGITHAGAKISSLITTASERDHADFRKGYGYGSRWTPGTRLVTTGSKEFEAGIYAGISDNPENQGAFVEAHRDARWTHAMVASRIDRHKAVTARLVAKNEVPSSGLYLLASTSMDLNTMAPNTTPAADGSTPINGPGRPGPLDGQQGAAAPGGPAPYNGAEPFGTPAVPGAGQAPEAPSPADALTGGGGMSTNNQVMSAKALAFRKTVQASLLAERQGK